MVRTICLTSIAIVLVHVLSLPLLGNSKIVIISQGPDCIYCTEQFHLLTQFEPILKKYGVKVVFGFASSPQSNSTCAPAQLQHGSFILNSLGHVAWSDLGPGPFLGVGALIGADAFHG